MARILIADDQPDVLEALRILLKGAGHQTDAVTSLAGIFNALEKKDYALLLMDLNYTRDTTSGQEGLEVIPKLQESDSTLPIVVMTAWATIDLAVEGMNRASAARALTAIVTYHDHGEYGRTVGNDFRKRTLRACQRRIHRRENGSCRPVRTGGREYALHG